MKPLIVLTVFVSMLSGCTKDGRPFMERALFGWEDPIKKRDRLRDEFKPTPEVIAGLDFGERPSNTELNAVRDAYVSSVSYSLYADVSRPIVDPFILVNAKTGEILTTGWTFMFSVQGSNAYGGPAKEYKRVYTASTGEEIYPAYGHNVYLVEDGKAYYHYH